LQRILERAIKKYCAIVKDEEVNDYLESFLTNLDEVANGDKVQ
jgi:hypothetical protein